VRLSDLPEWLLRAIDNPPKERKEFLDRISSNWAKFGGHVGKLDEADCTYIIYRELNREKGVRRNIIDRAATRICAIRRSLLLAEITKITVRYARKNH